MTRFPQRLFLLCVSVAAGLAASAAAGMASPQGAPLTPSGALAPSTLALPAAGDDLLAQAQVPAAEPVSAPSTSVAPAVLRSLAVPGWGQFHQGHRDIGLIFSSLEAALVTTALVSVGQGHLRRGSSENTAMSFAGIDLTTHDDVYRKRVSDFRSSEEYNRLVIYREAANLYYGDYEKYNEYIETRSLKGEDAWAWETDEAWDRYRQQRRSSESAFQRARFAAAGMIVNRVASMITAAAMGRRGGDGQAAAGAADGMALGGVEWTVRPGSDFTIEHRLAWVLRF